MVRADTFTLTLKLKVELIGELTLKLTAAVLEGRTVALVSIAIVPATAMAPVGCATAAPGGSRSWSYCRPRARPSM